MATISSDILASYAADAAREVRSDTLLHFASDSGHGDPPLHYKM